MHKPLIQHNCQQIKKKKWNLKKCNKPNISLNILDSITEWFKYQKGKKTHQLISPINTDHVMFIWRGKPVLSFSKSYQNTEIAKYFGVKCYCIIRSIYVFQVTPSLTWIGIFFSFFVQDCFYTELLMFDIQY